MRFEIHNISENFTSKLLEVALEHDWDRTNKPGTKLAYLRSKLILPPLCCDRSLNTLFFSLLSPNLNQNLFFPEVYIVILPGLRIISHYISQKFRSIIYAIFHLLIYF